jgi:succinoglycan biosynthesis protein ExoV
MKLHYAKLHGGNFGDDLNPWMWSRLLPGVLNDDNSEVFVGIGTVLNHLLNHSRGKIVFGTGTGYGDPPKIDERWRIYCVRGPLTARKLGLEPMLAIADAAYLLRVLQLRAVEKKYKVSFVPHHASLPDVDWHGLCAQAGLHCISPALSVDEFLPQLMASELVIAEAMHGAIVADAFRIPWIPVRYGYRSFDFKWHDWCNSVGLNYEPIDLPNLLQTRLGHAETIARVVRWGLGMTGLGKSKWRRMPIFQSSAHAIDMAASSLVELSRGERATLSPVPVFQTTMHRLEDKFEELREDLKSGVFATAGPLRS